MIFRFTFAYYYFSKSIKMSCRCFRNTIDMEEAIKKAKFQLFIFISFKLLTATYFITMEIYLPLMIIYFDPDFSYTRSLPTMILNPMLIYKIEVIKAGVLSMLGFMLFIIILCLFQYYGFFKNKFYMILSAEIGITISWIGMWISGSITTYLIHFTSFMVFAPFILGSYILIGLLARFNKKQQKKIINLNSQLQRSFESTLISSISESTETLTSVPNAITSLPNTDATQTSEPEIAQIISNNHRPFEEPITSLIFVPREPPPAYEARSPVINVNLQDLIQLNTIANHNQDALELHTQSSDQQSTNDHPQNLPSFLASHQPSYYKYN